MADVHYEGERFLFRGEIRQYHLGQVIKVNIINNRTNDTILPLNGTHREGHNVAHIVFAKNV